jgi:hypothetical protein
MLIKFAYDAKVERVVTRFKRERDFKMTSAF